MTVVEERDERLLDACVCARCGRPHSVEEFKESRFCRDCGKFLSWGNEKPLDPDNEGRPRKMSAERETDSLDLFPYDPYPQQLEFIKDVEDILGGGGVLVAEACNGFGKTVCALSSTLPTGRKIIYATRTHEQVRQVLREVEQINKKAETDFSAVALASRQNLCLNEVCRRLPPIEAVEACRVLRRTRRCPYKSEPSRFSSSLPPVLSTRRLLEYGRDRGVCPYFLARKFSETCTVVVAPYQYIFNEAIRAMVKLVLSGKILIFDEAHNADKIGQEALSDTLSERALNNAKRELELVDASPTFIDELADYLATEVSDEPVLKPGFELLQDLSDLLGEAPSLLVDSLTHVVEEIRELKIARGEVPVCYLNGVLNFLSLVGSSDSKKYVAIYRRGYRGINLIEYRCLDPSLAIQPVIQEAYSALVMSGTLSPLSFFTQVLGLTEAETRTYSAIVNPENVRTFIDGSVTTRFRERNTEMLRLYGERISSLMRKVPNGALVFFPQRRLMIDALEAWRGNGFIKEQEEEALLLSGKRVFVEGERASENAKIVDEYKEAARSREGAVLFAVFRGRNAEGSNFPYEEARGIFNVGLPYADYRDPLVKAQIEFFNRKRQGLGELWYVMDAFRAANQAMGRGIRHRDDWCHFFLMDKRYGTHWKFISKWARENGIEKVSPRLD